MFAHHLSKRPNRKCSNWYSLLKMQQQSQSQVKEALPVTPAIYCIADAVHSQVKQYSTLTIAAKHNRHSTVPQTNKQL